MRVITAALTASLILPLSTISAQQAPPIEVGARVRVTAPDCGITDKVARFMRVHRDTLTVQADSVMKLPLIRIVRMDVSSGRSNGPMIAGAILGTVLGAAGGAVLANPEDCSGGILDTCPLEQSAGAVLAGAVIGGFVGGLVGKAARGHRWEEVPLDRLHVGVAPQRDGFAVGLSVSF